MGLFNFFKKDDSASEKPKSTQTDLQINKSEEVSKSNLKEYFWQCSQDEIEPWFKEKKKAGFVFDTDQYKAIMKMIAKNYEDELLKELDTLKDVNYYQWMDEVKSKKKVISDKVYAKAVALANGKEWLSDEVYQENVKWISGDDINRPISEVLSDEIDDIYDNCKPDDFDEISSIRDEDDDLIIEMEEWISESRIIDEDDAKSFIKECVKDKIYTPFYFRKVAKLILKEHDIYI